MTKEKEHDKQVIEKKTFRPPMMSVQKHLPTLTLDARKYEHFLEHSDMTEEQKQEYLQMLWSVICEFVSLGFGVHPLQQVESDCGQSSENSAQSTFIALDMLNFEHNQTCEKFKDVAESETQPQGEGV